MANTALVTVCKILIIDKTGPTPGNNWEQRLNNVNWGETDNLESLWESLRDLAASETNKIDESDGDAPVSKTLFVPYIPARLKGGTSHPCAYCGVSFNGRSATTGDNLQAAPVT